MRKLIICFLLILSIFIVGCDKGTPKESVKLEEELKLYVVKDYGIRVIVSDNSGPNDRVVLYANKKNIEVSNAEIFTNTGSYTDFNIAYHDSSDMEGTFISLRFTKPFLYEVSFEKVLVEIASKKYETHLNKEYVIAPYLKEDSNSIHCGRNNSTVKFVAKISAYTDFWHQKISRDQSFRGYINFKENIKITDISLFPNNNFPDDMSIDEIYLDNALYTKEKEFIYNASQETVNFRVLISNLYAGYYTFRLKYEVTGIEYECDSTPVRFIPLIGVYELTELEDYLEYLFTNDELVLFNEL